MVNLTDISDQINLIKYIFIVFMTQITILKMIDDKNYFSMNKIVGYLIIICIIPILRVVSSKTNFFISNAVLVFLLTCVCSISIKEKIGYTLILTIIALACNYAIYFISIVLVFIVNSLIVNINSDSVNLIFIMIIHITVLHFIFKIKRLKYGITTLKKNFNNSYIEMLILNISVGILFMGVIFSDKQLFLISNSFWIFIIFSIIMFITIQKSLQLYYKQKMLIKELDETKEDLARAENKIKILEKENIEESKKRHTIIHKQKSIEYKLEEMLTKTEMSTEEAAEVRERLEKLNKEVYTEKEVMELDKTGINSIDDMLKYMQSECVKNKIDFTLQIKGNIHYMVHNLVKEEELETLLADHIKDAIIAINHTDNANRSILVRLGNIDDIYSLYIYDSGVEFKPEVLESLGKKPCTTYASEGGTGMGFMNTFDTVRKHKASLIIEEIGKPVKDNYTKVIIIKFDKKNEFKVKSYHEIEKV